MIRRTSKTVSLLIILPFLLLSCGRETFYTDSVGIPAKTWKLTNVAEFSFPVTDTVRLTDVVFTIRTGSDYPFRNIWLFVTVESPDSKIITDTLQYDLADEKGNWHGKGPGDVHELNLPYRTNVFFPLRGTYKFRIRHGMRILDLPGVYDIGIRIGKPGS